MMERLKRKLSALKLGLMSERKFREMLTARLEAAIRLAEE